MRGQLILFKSSSGEHRTPPDFFEVLSKEWGPFDLDAAANERNTLCNKYYTKKQDGLTQAWGDSWKVFVNPPYGRGVRSWVNKAAYEAANHNNTVVMLLPARTDTKWFHEGVIPTATEVLFIKGRLRFVGCKDDAPFPSMVVVWKPHADENWEQKITFGRLRP